MSYLLWFWALVYNKCAYFHLSNGYACKLNREKICTKLRYENMVIWHICVYEGTNGICCCIIVDICQLPALSINKKLNLIRSRDVHALLKMRIYG